MKRNLVCVVFAAGMGVALASGADDPLLFPKGAFTVETKAVKTSRGERKVTYRSYKHVPYVAKPVDKDYQSLDVNVPVEVDGVAVDASPVSYTHL